MIKRLAQSFLISGCLGVLVAVALYILGSFPYTRHFAASAGLILCPGMILVLAEPTTTAENNVSSSNRARNQLHPLRHWRTTFVRSLDMVSASLYALNPDRCWEILFAPPIHVELRTLAAIDEMESSDGPW
jgi:hypothetical protein